MSEQENQNELISEDMLDEIVDLKDKATEEDIDPEILAAVENDDTIPDDIKHATALHLQMKLNNSEGLSPSERTAVITASVAMLAVVTSTYSRDAYAFTGVVNRFVDTLISSITGPLMSLLQPLIENAMGIFKGFVDGGSAANTGAVTSAADSQNHVNVTIEEERIKRNAVPAPQGCISDILGESSVEADAKKEAGRTVGVASLSSLSLADNPNVHANDFRLQVERHGNTGRNLDVNSILTDDGINEDDDYVAANDFLKNVVGQEKKSPRNSDINIAFHQGSTAVAHQMQAEKATALNRRQVAMVPLVDAMSARDNRTGRSEKEILKTEVRRAYGSSSEGWRSELNGYVEPTPLLIELNRQAALSNHILLKQLEAIQVGNMVDSVELLELLDR